MSIPIQIADGKDYLRLASKTDMKKVCDCGRVIEHSGPSEWCSVRCPVFQKYATRPQSSDTFRNDRQALYASERYA